MPALFYPMKIPLLLILACSTTPLLASPTLETDIRPGVLYFDYSEFNSGGDTLNEEKGWIPGLTFEASAVSAPWRVSAIIEYFSGDTSYDGSTQTGAGLNSHTEQRFFSLALNAQGSLFDSGLDGYVRLQRNHWRRHIQATANTVELLERYRWLTIESGVAGRYALTTSAPAHELQWRVGTFWTRNGKINADLDVLNLGDIELDLSNGRGWAGAMSYQAQLLDSTTLSLGLEYRQWRISRGSGKNFTNGSQIFTIAEPSSKTRRSLFFIGLGTSF